MCEMALKQVTYLFLPTLPLARWNVQQIETELKLNEFFLRILD